MDRLRQLASDVRDVGDTAELCGENATDACLAVVDEFCAEHEAKEVWDCPPDEDTCRSYHLWHQGANKLTEFKRVSIIVPRKVPTLLEAAEGASEAWHESHLTTPAMCDAMLALDTAIERERAK